MLVSVIIPCYNVEKYIDKCLESIVKQSIGVECLEIICVDDCSTDNTLYKLKQWEEQYSDNIMVITYEENQRQGGARNIGIQYSTCDLISFVDSDDWIDEDMFRILVEKRKNYDYDVVACKFVRDDGKTLLEEKEHKDIDVVINDDKAYHWWNLSGQGNNGEYGGSVAAIYKKDMIIDNNIWFPAGLAYEDNYWINVLMLYVKSVYVVDKCYYHYRINNESTTMSQKSTHHFERLTIEEMLIDKYKELGVFKLFYVDIFWDFLQRYYLGTLYICFTRNVCISAQLFNHMKDVIYCLYHDLDSMLEAILLHDISRSDRMLLEELKSRTSVDDIDMIRLGLDYLNCLQMRK